MCATGSGSVAASSDSSRAVLHGVLGVGVLAVLVLLGRLLLEHEVGLQVHARDDLLLGLAAALAA